MDKFLVIFKSGGTLAVMVQESDNWVDAKNEAYQKVVSDTGDIWVFVGCHYLSNPSDIMYITPQDYQLG
jgi:hypothetical protein